MDIICQSLSPFLSRGKDCNTPINPSVWSNVSQRSTGGSVVSPDEDHDVHHTTASMTEHFPEIHSRTI